ncbi:uncharacterized protein METZ01_LOCUS488410, partial [marine metagenome]
LDTDLEILIPDNYVSNVEERFNLYKELNNFLSEKEITIFSKSLEDRFGKLPKAVCYLFDALRLRWIGKEVGFRRIILKSDYMKAFFIEDKNSFYFETPQFLKVLEYCKTNFQTTKIKEKNGKLSVIVEDISTIKEAIDFCKNFSLNNLSLLSPNFKCN